MRIRRQSIDGFIIAENESRIKSYGKMAFFIVIMYSIYIMVSSSEEEKNSGFELLLHENDVNMEACLMCGLLRIRYIPGSKDDHCPRCNFKEGCCYS